MRCTKCLLNHYVIAVCFFGFSHISQGQSYDRSDRLSDYGDGQEPIMERYRSPNIYDMRASEQGVRTAAATLKLAEANRALAIADRFSQIRRTVSEQGAKVKVFLQNVEYESDLVRFLTENPYGLFENAVDVTAKTNQLREQNRMLREGESIENHKTNCEYMATALSQAAKEHDTLLSLVKQNQENYRQEQVLEIQEQMITQQRKLLQQQQQHSDDMQQKAEDIEFEIRQIKQRLNN